MSEPWQGLDEAVVERFAAEAGRHPRGPLIPTDQGDLLIFVFLVAGLVAGFVIGYNWRLVFVDGAAAPAKKRS